jgi:hypothetical protein
MSKLRPIYVIIPGVLLVIIVVCVFAFVLLPPVKDEIAEREAERDKEMAKANEEDAVRERLADAEKNLEEQQAKLDRYMETRSIPISAYQPVQMMIAMWFELQEDLPPEIEEFIEASGCRIVQGAGLPAPEMEKPSLGPSNFLRIPGSGALSFRVQGTMEEIRRLYASLNTFKRVATISNFDLTSATGDELEVGFDFTVYLLAEGPEGGGGGGGGGGGAPGGGMMMPGGPGMGSGPPMGMPGTGPGMAPEAMGGSGPMMPGAGGESGMEFDEP